MHITVNTQNQFHKSKNQKPNTNNKNRITKLRKCSAQCLPTKEKEAAWNIEWGNFKSERAAGGCPAKIFKINNNEINQKIHYNKRNNSITPPTLPMTLPLSRTTFVHHRSFRFDTSESSLYHTIILSILSIRWFHFNLKLEFRGLKVSKLQKY